MATINNTETSVFSNLLKKTAANNSLPARMREARDWVAKNTNAAMRSPSAVIKKAPSGQAVSSPKQSIIGSMVLFQYNATTAKDLPYWDKFPLVFPFELTSDGMYGINMHYLPPLLRARLMDSLMTIADSNTIDAKTKLNLSYATLQSAARNRYFVPCVKRYLNSGLASRMVTIPATEWNLALFLPLERFQKASAERVYRDSQRKIRGH